MSNLSRCFLGGALLAVVSLLVIGWGNPVVADESSALPQVVPSGDDGQFSALVESSPFTRSLNVSDTLVVSGAAEVEGIPVLTVLDTEDGSSTTVSSQPNYLGWRLKSVTGQEALERVTASISLPSGEVMRIRYDEARLKSTAQRMRNKSRARQQVAAARVRQENGKGHGVAQERVNLLKKIDQNELPKGYKPGAGKNKEESHQLHQSYVDGRMSGFSPQQRSAVGQLWKQKVAVNPNMANRGASFVRIMEHVAKHHR